MTTASPTPSELLVQRQELDRQIAQANLAGMKAIRDALKSGKAGTLAADLEALLPQLAPANEIGSRFSQANNVISIMRGVTDYFDREIASIEAASPPAEA
ncbi:hypothetical protein TomMM35A_18740 [Sphingobium sp. TomMM35A]